jgi:hypothetical protein
MPSKRRVPWGPRTSTEHAGGRRFEHAVRVNVRVGCYAGSCWSCMRAAMVKPHVTTFTAVTIALAWLALAALGCGRTGLAIGRSTRGDAGAQTQAACPSCAELNAQCGTVDTTCGTLACGSCTPPLFCGGAGVANRCDCVARTCAAAGAECGEIIDGCGGVLSCGVCPPSEICGGAGPNRCGPRACRATTCDQLGAECGAASDGCSHVLQCGTCRAPNSCGGAAVEHRCGCAKRTCAQLGAECGVISDGCGGQLHCGMCQSPASCGGGGVANSCGCTPATCDALGAHCGLLPDGCGGLLSCGSCSRFGRGRRVSVCLGIGPSDCSEEGLTCTPASCARYGAECGMAADGCGGVLNCGTCKAPLTCGGASAAQKCGCTATTCDKLGAVCGSVRDGCGGSLDCGRCPAGQRCDPTSNQCLVTL